MAESGRVCSVSFRKTRGGMDLARPATTPLQSLVSTVPPASITSSLVPGVDGDEVHGIAEAVLELQGLGAPGHAHLPIDDALAFEWRRRQAQALHGVVHGLGVGVARDVADRDQHGTASSVKW